ncbi:MAG: S-adenosylmethionine:tRNA ribosyltransferase-isomerase [Flavobacteriales bacterium]|nr:S-adenosylmethionine:tRNA ribosyltransferase-isomerase [Flavobacteriales bacterium]
MGHTGAEKMEFDYTLPESHIAKHPPARREDARLLHVDSSGKWEDRGIADLPHVIPPDSQLWVNETRVLHARMMAVKPTGGALELLLLEPANIPVEQALTAKSPVTWNAMVGGAKKWKSGALSVPDSGVDLTVERDGEALRFSWQGEEDFGTVLDRLGRIPLPPYMRRSAEAADAERYQTVFARLPGSVAAPTAGLHLTENLLGALAHQGVHCGKVTLHVGVGTFKPLQGDPEGHLMHGERCIVSRKGLEELAKGQAITAVGTTTMRTLESLFWLACRWREHGVGPEQEIEQWVYKGIDQPFDTFAAAAAWLLERTAEQGGGLEFVTHLMIVPGYRVRSAERLLTNFHMPNSTLLCIVEAMLGPIWREVYAHAVAENYRFLSYGDACLLERRG